MSHSTRFTSATDYINARKNVAIHLEYDPELPVCERRAEIADAIANNQVVVICGETGSGKSTQIPKICLELGFGVKRTIGHTQPRRIAARSVAVRIAEELRTPLGQGVGYKVRFTDECGPATRVKLMTDGILLAESQTDPFFNQYEVLIIDEAHERSLNIDFLLGMFKRILARRKDLKLIVTSATIDAQKFADHFSTFDRKVPIIEVSGRTYPIDILYRSPDPRELNGNEDDFSSTEANGANRNKNKQEMESEDDAFERTLLQAVDETTRFGRGDILLFMPTEHDIFETAKLLKRHRIPGDDAVRKTEILPLYARLPVAEQQKIFRPSSWRRIVLATNVAESSLTVPGIKYVIDTGTARISRYSARSKTQRLPIEPISRASADQRAGRCGRVGPGICIRLYSEQDYLSRDRYTVPEIRRTNLAAVILQTKAFRLGEVERFPFIDPPAISAINDGYKTLFEIGAVDAQHELTELGKRLARIPVDPRIARIILAANDENCLREILIIAAVLEIQDPRERPFEQREKADEKHAPFLHEESDFLAWIKLWDFWIDLKDKLSGSKLRKAARENFLSWNRMKEWTDIHLQLLRIVRDSKLTLRPRRDDYNAIHKAILSGLLYGIARKTETAEYLTTGNTKFFLWPGSGAAKKKHQWIVASERLETNRKYLRTIGRIDPIWIEPIAGHLLEHRYFEPFWNAKSGCVQAWERVTLYGLEIIAKRRINFGPLDTKQAHEIFLREALVEGRFQRAPDFFLRNQETRQAAEELQEKLRNFRLLRGEDIVYQFYNTRIPEFVYDRVSLEKWIRTLDKTEKNKLLMTVEDLCAEELPENLDANFPDTFLTGNGMNLPIEYRFRPGENDDGLSITTGPETLNQLDSASLGWLVPGLIEAKIAAALKTLPKDIRRDLVPIPDTAKKIRDSIRYGEGDFFDVIARHATRLAGKPVAPDDFQTDRIPQDLLMNIKIVNEDGAVIEESRDLIDLREKLSVQISKSFQSVTISDWNRDGLKKWDFGQLPEFVSIPNRSIPLKGFPALCDPMYLMEENRQYPPNTLSLRLFDTINQAKQQLRFGVLRLFCIKCHDELIGQAKWMPDNRRYALLLRSIPNLPQTNSFIAELIAAVAFDEVKLTLPKNEIECERFIKITREKIATAVQEVTAWLAQFVPAAHNAILLSEKNKTGSLADCAEDVDFQISQLLTKNFHWVVPWTNLKEFPRYLKGIEVRFEKFKNGGAIADRRGSDQMIDLWNEYVDIRERLQRAGIDDPELNTYRWMLEEYRIFLFAQKLGTPVKISEVRLQRQREKIAK